MGSGASTEPEAASEFTDEEKARVAVEAKILLSSPIMSNKDQLDGIVNSIKNSRMSPDGTAAAAATAKTTTTKATETETETETTTAATTPEAGPITATAVTEAIAPTILATAGPEKLTIESSQPNVSDTLATSQELLGNVGFEVRSPPRLLSFISSTPSKKRPDEVSSSSPHLKKFLANQSSKDIVNLMDPDTTQHDVRIKDLLNELRSETLVSSPSAHSFRQRRLTFGSNSKRITADAMAKGVEDEEPTIHRTTVYSSTEFGLVVKDALPFPADVMGTYSCHGIEPSPFEPDGISQKINQDRGCVVHPFNGSMDEALFSVMDGHGGQGDKVSEFVMRQLVVTLEKDPQMRTNPGAALTDAFVYTNRALMGQQMDYATSGTTCVTVYIQKEKIWVANVGDSRAVMACEDDAGNYLAKDLSIDHKPDDPEEQKRIEAAGGFVAPPADVGLSARVYLDPNFTRIGLAMSRSIGDYAVKTVGVIPEPEIFTYDVQVDYRFMILASDGVWEFISSQEAVNIVLDELRKEPSSSDFSDSVETTRVMKACQVLIEEAQARWEEEEGDYRDDITAIIVMFPLMA